MTCQSFVLTCCATIAAMTLPSICFAQDAVAPQDSYVARYLYVGNAKDGVKEVKEKLRVQKSEQLKFELATLKFFSAIETLGQKFAQHGKTRSVLGMIPFLRLEVGEELGAERITYEEFRNLFQNFQTEIDEVYETLGGIGNAEVKLTLDLAKVHLDINKDGAAQKREQLMVVVGRALGDLRNQENLVVDFDRSDAIWLQGYCSLASAMCDFILALDFEESWNLGAATIFDGAESVFEFQRQERASEYHDYRFFVDIIATIHKSTWKVQDRQRMINCHSKLLRMVEHSRENWKSIQAETDREREWLPNAKQVAFQPRLQVPQEMINAWGLVLNEWESMLQGRKLIPFWRGVENRQGVNLKRLFYELEEVDPIMIIQGSPMLPYLEGGPIATADEWQQLTRNFQGNFIGFAIWAN